MASGKAKILDARQSLPSHGGLSFSLANRLQRLAWIVVWTVAGAAKERHHRSSRELLQHGNHHARTRCLGVARRPSMRWNARHRRSSFPAQSTPHHDWLWSVDRDGGLHRAGRAHRRRSSGRRALRRFRRIAAMDGLFRKSCAGDSSPEKLHFATVSGRRMARCNGEASGARMPATNEC